MEFPTLFAIAMDYLPIQATSVPCERVFSSARESDTAKRNRMSPLLMEALQLLKFSLKKQRLNFTEGWKTSEALMGGASWTNPDHDLSSLLVDDPDGMLDRILEDFNAYDYE